MCASSAGGISPAAIYEQDRQVQLNKDLLVNKYTKTCLRKKDLLAKESASMPRVLIADDEDSMRTLVARAIAMDGHDIVTAEDGAEALEILSREQGAFDLLLTDIQMPVMDGIALALTAARDFPDLTILLMTGFADQRERASGLNAIVHDVVTKPFSVADIRTAVAEALAARKSG
jgi:two-component system cell cycle response regulator CpdR